MAKKSKSNTSTNFLSLSKPAFSSETISITGDKITGGVPDYSAASKEALNARLNAINVASTSAVNAIKSLNTGENTVAAKFGELLPSAIQAAKAGAKYRNLFNKYDKQNKQSVSQLEKTLKQQKLNISNTEYVEGKASESLRTFAAKMQDKDSSSALEALHLDDFDSRQTELAFAAGQLRDTVHRSMEKEKFYINGEWVVKESCVGNQCVLIENQIDAGYYAWLEQNTDFGEKEIYNYVAYPNKVKQAKEQVTKALEKEKENLNEIKDLQTEQFKNGLIKPSSDGRVTVLSDELSIAAEANLPTDNLVSLLDTRLDQALYLFENNPDVDYITVKNMVERSGPITIKVGDKLEHYDSLMEYKPFKAKIQKFLNKLNEIEGKNVSIKGQEIRKIAAAVSDRWIVKFENATEENFDQLMIDFTADFTNSGLRSQTFLDPVLKNIITNRVTKDTEGELALYWVFAQRKNAGVYVDPTEYSQLSQRFKNSLDKISIFSVADRQNIINPFIERYIDARLLASAYKGSGIDYRSEAANAEGHIRRELEYLIGSKMNALKKTDAYSNQPDEVVLAAALKELNTEHKELFADPNKLRTKIKYWAIPGVGPNIETIEHINNRRLNTDTLITKHIGTNNFKDSSTYFQIPTEQQEGFQEPTNFQEFLGVQFPTVGETSDILNELSEWINGNGKLESNYWQKIAQANNQGPNKNNQISKEEVALKRAYALKLVNDEQYLTKLEEIRQNSSQPKNNVEASSTPNLTEIIETDGGKDLDSAILNSDVLPIATQQVNDGSLDSVYNYTSKPIIINDKEVLPSKVTFRDLLGYLKTNTDAEVGAYGITHKKFIDLINSLPNNVVDDSGFNLDKPFNEEQQNLLRKLFLLHRSNQAKQTVGMNSNAYNLVFISQDIAQLLSGNSETKVHWSNDPSSGTMFGPLINSQLQA